MQKLKIIIHIYKLLQGWGYLNLDCSSMMLKSILDPEIYTGVDKSRLAVICVEKGMQIMVMINSKECHSDPAHPRHNLVSVQIADLHY